MSGRDPGRSEREERPPAESAGSARALTALHSPQPRALRARTRTRAASAALGGSVHSALLGGRAGSESQASAGGSGAADELHASSKPRSALPRASGA